MTTTGSKSLDGDPQPSPVAVSDLQATRNEYGRPVKDVFVKFNLYDEQGNLIGNTIDYVSNLEAGARWVINAQSPNEFSSFKMTGVDTY